MCCFFVTDHIGAHVLNAKQVDAVCMEFRSATPVQSRTKLLAAAVFTATAQHGPVQAQ